MKHYRKELLHLNKKFSTYMIIFSTYMLIFNLYWNSVSSFSETIFFSFESPFFFFASSFSPLDLDSSRFSTFSLLLLQHVSITAARKIRHVVLLVLLKVKEISGESERRRRRRQLWAGIATRRRKHRVTSRVCIIITCMSSN